MPSARKSYELPDRPPIPYRVWVRCVAVPVLALSLWLVFPDSAVTLVLLFAAVVLAVFSGVWHLLSDPDLEEPPRAEPMPPPSAPRPDR
jgi:hypothetical protein